MRRPPLPTALAVALAAALAAGCSDLAPGGDDLEAEIEAQRSVWLAQRPAAYVYELERLCFCGEEARGPVRITVSGGRVEAWSYTSDGTAVVTDFEPLFPSVDGLFDILVDAVRRDAHQIRVTWDPATGAPLDFWIDYEANLADEEQGYRIVALPRPAP